MAEKTRLNPTDRMLMINLCHSLLDEDENKKFECPSYLNEF